MLLARASFVGVLNAVRSTSETAMPSTPAVIALFIALTISLTLLDCEPVHWYSQPKSLHASSAPYLVGTKNGFVVTWLTKVNLYSGCVPKMSAASPWALVEPPPQASIAIAAAAAPAPVSAVRRVKARHLECGVSS